jgi:hypothetical protein
MMAPDTLPRKAMTLERVLLAAASAIASALATFSFLTWRKRRKARPPHVAHMASAHGQAPVTLLSQGLAAGQTCSIGLLALYSNAWGAASWSPTFQLFDRRRGGSAWRGGARSKGACSWTSSWPGRSTAAGSWRQRSRMRPPRATQPRLSSRLPPPQQLRRQQRRG